MKGVRQVVTLDPSKPPLAVPAARRRRGHRRQHVGGDAGPQALKVEWNDGPHAAFDSARVQATNARHGQAARQGRPQPRQRRRRVRQGRQGRRGQLLRPHHAHATMEPPAAVADFRDGKVTAWAPMQNPQAAQDTVAAALGIDKKNVVCHVTLLGGGFGRKSKPDYVAEAALLAKQVGKAGQGRVDARGRPPVRLLPRRRRGVSQGHRRSARQAHGVARTIGVPADRLDVHRRANATGWTSSWAWG